MNYLNNLTVDHMEFWGWVFFTLGVGLVISYVMSRVIVRIAGRYLGRIQGLHFLVRYVTSSAFSNPIVLVFLGWIWLAGFGILRLSTANLVTISLVAKTLTYVGFTGIIWQSADLVRGVILNTVAKKNTKIDALLAPLISRIVKILALIFGAVSLAELLHLPIASLITGLGIGGVAIAMAAKDTLANMFGSLSILTDRPFQIGDWIKVGELEGNVEQVGFRSTRIRTFYDSVLTIPNANLLTGVVDNMGARKYRRFKTTLHLVATTTADLVTAFCNGIQEIVSQKAAIRQDDVSIVVSEVNPTQGICIQITVFYKVKDAEEESSEKHQLWLQILSLAQTLGVSWHSSK